MVSPKGRSAAAAIIGAAEENSNDEGSLQNLAEAGNDAADTAASVDSVLEAIGFGRFQVMTMMICGMGWFVDSVEVGGLTYIYVTLDEVWGTTTKHWGLLQSARSIASVVGALCFGSLADKFGRRPAYLATLALTAVGGVASAAAGSFHSLLLLRVVTNVGAGGILPVAITLLTEHLPPSARDSCMVLMHIFFATGHVLAVLISMALPSTEGMWRIFLLALAAPAALLLLAWRVVPESPVYLHQTGKEAQARQALEAISRANGQRKAPLPRRGPLPLHSSSGSSSSGSSSSGGSSSSSSSTSDLSPEKEYVHVESRLQAPGPKDAERSTGVLRLFSTRGGACQMALFGLLWACTMTASDYSSWITELGHGYGFRKHTVEAFMIACKVIGVVAFFSAAACARGGRGPLILCAAYLAAALAAAGAAMAASLEASRLLVPACIALLSFPFDIVWSLLYAVTASRFDALCRASALSVASGCSRAAAAVAPLASGALLMKGPLPALCFWSGAWGAACCVAWGMLCRRGGEGKGSEGKGAGQAC